MTPSHFPGIRFAEHRLADLAKDFVEVFLRELVGHRVDFDMRYSQGGSFGRRLRSELLTLDPPGDTACHKRAAQ